VAHDHEPAKPHRITISTVAAALGVAVSTVSNAYNRPDQLSAELRERVLAVAAELGYPGPNPVARSLRQQRAGAVGVLFAERLPYAFRDPAVLMVLEGIATTLEQAGLGLLLVPGRDDDTTTVQQALVDGFIVYSMMETDPLVQAALKRRLPTVLLDQPPRPDVPSIIVDDEAGARMATEHLLSLGHRQFAIITDRLVETNLRPSSAPINVHDQSEPTFFVTQLRLQGYRQPLEAAGIDWRSVPIYDCNDNNEIDGAAAIQILLAHNPRPTAILCLTDRLALGAISGAQQAGYQVPQQLSIVGFDDIPQASQSVPSLTTIRQDHRQKGLSAGQALIELLAGQSPTSYQRLAVELVVRDSTAAI